MHSYITTQSDYHQYFCDTPTLLWQVASFVNRPVNQMMIFFLQSARRLGSKVNIRLTDCSSMKSRRKTHKQTNLFSISMVSSLFSSGFSHLSFLVSYFAFFVSAIIIFYLHIPLHVIKTGVDWVSKLGWFDEQNDLLWLWLWLWVVWVRLEL